MKTKIGVYLTKDVAKQLKAAVRRTGATKSDIVNEALARLLDVAPVKDPGDEVLRRLTGLARSLRRIHREVEVVAETLALHVRQFLMITPPLPESDRHEAEKLGCERYRVFLAQVAKRITSDTGMVSEIMQTVGVQPRAGHVTNIQRRGAATCRAHFGGCFAWLNATNSTEATWAWSRCLRRTPQLCAGALACLGSAPWFNIIGPCAGLVVGILALLVATAVSLVVADWRAETASRETWAIIGIAAAELSHSGPSQTDSCYLVTSDDRRWQSVFRTHRPAASDARAQFPAATSVIQNFSQTGGPLPAVAELATAPTVANRISAPSVTENAIPFQEHRSASLALVQTPRVAAFRPARLGMVYEQSSARAVRLVANGGSGPKGSLAVGASRRHMRNARKSLFSAAIRAVAINRTSAVLRRAMAQLAAVSRQVVEDHQPPRGGRLTNTRTVPDGRMCDPAVHDNLGRQVPVCAAELDVLEIYLEHVLQRLLASSPRAPDGDKS